MREAESAELREGAKQPRSVGAGEVEPEGSAGSEPVSEQHSVALELMLGVVWPGCARADRYCRQDAGVGSRSPTDIDDGEKVAVKRVGVAGPDIKEGGRTIGLCEAALRNDREKRQHEPATGANQGNLISA